MLKHFKIKSFIRVLFLLLLLLPGCIKENPVDPPSVDNSNPDPLYTDQWHLNNTGQGGGTAGEDINVEPVWNDGYYGSGVYIAIVDDGLDTDHEDLYANVVKHLNYNYITGYTTVYPGTHGTSVAGVAAAAHNNPYGGRGAAPGAGIFNYNLLYAFTNSNQQDAMIRNKDLVCVTNNSWGPSDDGHFYVSPSLWKAGIDEGVTTGRGGKGIVYTWAGGNGGGNSDNSNYDGYANYYGVIAVAAVNNSGVQSCYSEPGANIWISAYSNDSSSCLGSGLGITTTDIMGPSGYDSGNYTADFGGTSSAAPLVAGVVALILDANPNLTWRDVKLILAQTARDEMSDGAFILNQGGAGYSVSYKYGFGVIDTSAAVELAKTWTNVGSMVTTTPYKSGTLGTTIPDNNSTGIENTITVTSSGISNIEYVEIDVTIEHPDAGDLEITLTSPDGTDSILAESHSCYTSGGSSTACTFFNVTGGNTFTFGSVRHLGETANSGWKLTVKDLTLNNTGTLVDWSIKFYGREEE